MKRPILLPLAALGLLLLAALPVRADYTLMEAINEAGRQRMLTQRIVKSYTQLGLGVADERSRSELRYAMELFQSQLDRLYQVDKLPGVHQQLGQIETIWASFQHLAAGEVDKQRAKALLAMSGVLQSECNRLVTILEKAANSRLGALVNVAGRQRMLSQRLTTFYLMRSWGIEHPALDPGIRNTRAEFRKAQALLRENSLDNLEIVEQLAQIDQDWAWFESALEQPQGERYDLVVMDASEELLHSLEYLVALYEVAADPNL
ncbi:type IV pili methyl-accepting chemotaxis transducer N-terminal domain-containing protein [Motiliproteus sediminis]|uniref:type IV pili methyl-accepting chemotaxis transducer N-terminal domain-containing protein n=1 Tax=Motiliproteus sediminis TaxID=1468178 RepID=UPI001AF024D3|nr:type IV pili methyl-accepting chemotaxis transducer N-terminal domain-containing protein [Motiliproteus sediminis]